MWSYLVFIVALAEVNGAAKKYEGEGEHDAQYDDTQPLDDMHRQVHGLHAHLSNMLGDALHEDGEAVPAGHIDDLFTKLHAVAHQAESESPKHEDPSMADIEIGSYKSFQKSVAKQSYSPGGGYQPQQDDDDDESGGSGGGDEEGGSSSSPSPSPSGQRVLKLKLNDDLQTGTYDIDFGNGKKHLEMKINRQVPADSYDLVQKKSSSPSPSPSDEGDREEESSESSDEPGADAAGEDEEGGEMVPGEQKHHVGSKKHSKGHHHGHHGLGHGESASSESEKTEDTTPKTPGHSDGAPDEAIHENFMTTGGLRLSLTKADKKQKAHKIVETVKMLVSLGDRLRPVEDRLTAAVKDMPERAASKATEMLGHVKALRGYSAKVIGLMQALRAKDMTPEERKAAVLNLVEGLHEIQAGIKNHIHALKLLKPARKILGTDAQIAAMPKMLALLQRMHATVTRELADPKTKDLPQTKLDLKVYDTMKETVVKIEAVVLAAGKSMKVAKSEDEKARTQVAVSMAIKELTDNMKAKFKGYRQEAEDLKDSLLETKASATSSEKPVAQPSTESVAK